MDFYYNQIPSISSNPKNEKNKLTMHFRVWLSTLLVSFAHCNNHVTYFVTSSVRSCSIKSKIEQVNYSIKFNNHNCMSKAAICKHADTAPSLNDLFFSAACNILTFGIYWLRKC